MPHNLNGLEFGSMPLPDIKELVELICGDASAREAAAAAIKEEIDDIYGYSKYSREGIDWDLEYRLYSMTYLAKAIVGITGQPGGELGLKKLLASSYMELLGDYLEGELPEKVYEWGFEPDYTIEIAVFLYSVDELDWGDYELLELITVFGGGSSVESRGKFLERLVDRLNKDEEMLEYLTSTPDQELAEEEALQILELSPIFTTYGPEELDISPTALSLLRILTPIISSKRSGKNVSMRSLARLNCLTREDMMWIMNNLLILRVPNRVKAYEELYEALIKRGEKPKALLESLISDVKEQSRSKYMDEPRVKGLLRSISRLSIDKSQLANMSKELLDTRTRAGARLEAYKFIYEETKDRAILERAKRANVKRIREWASEISRSQH